MGPRGKVIATGTPDELKARTGGQVLWVAPSDPARLAEVATLLEALAASSMASGIPSSARQIRATVSALPTSSSKSGRTATQLTPADRDGAPRPVPYLKRAK
jgi:hypothetical protein